jgi:filamentous hemagglutinin family protein
MKSITAQFPLKKRMSSLIKVLCLSAICSFTIAPTDVKAQITPDGTVNTQTQQEGNNVDITGGTREGNNLFHSFEEFSIPTGEEASFLNEADIENIFTRVTGDSVSNIDGILRAQGSANLFLMNPSGIIFGENASLDIGGSFVGTTANSIEFADGNQFSAEDTTQKSVLTVSVPVGLGFMGNSPGPILVNGKGNQITPSTSKSPTSVQESTTGLLVDSGETLALIGGDVNLNGGTLKAPGGRVELGSVNSGSVSFQEVEKGLNFGFNNATINRNLALNNLSLLDASGEGKGAIFLTGGNINIADASVLLIQNRGDIQAEGVSINAPESLTLFGTSPGGKVSSAISTETLSSGKGGDITVSTSKLVLKDAASIRTTNYTDAEGGNVTINATESVQLLENTSVDPARPLVTSVISNAAVGSGNAGSLQVSTPQLKILDGGYITSSTFGTGAGGNVNINADDIEILGLKSNGNEIISISVISASSFNAGDAGILNINTEKLRITDGAQIASSSFATGNSGNVTINATDSIEVSGVGVGSQSLIGASADIIPDTDLIKKIYNLPEAPSGFSGNVLINTPDLNVNSGGIVSVKNDGTGDAGELSINADSIDLDDSGSISAASASGNGGNINIKTDRLSLDEESQVTATADNNGNGGNINIKTILLDAKKNSDITANAFAGKGGNITEVWKR